MNSPGLSFCKSWFRAKKRAIEMWDIEKARGAHDAGYPYTALIGSPDRPTHILEMSTGRGFVGVSFLDELMREYMCYEFKSADEDMIFLSTVIFREFEGAADQVVRGTTYFFRATGDVAIQRQTFRPTHIIETTHALTDVTGNFEFRPLFGAYDAILKRERVASPFIE